jgi:hypothetical protein
MTYKNEAKIAGAVWRIGRWVVLALGLIFGCAWLLLMVLQGGR